MHYGMDCFILEIDISIAVGITKIIVRMLFGRK